MSVSFRVRVGIAYIIIGVLEVPNGGMSRVKSCYVTLLVKMALHPYYGVIDVVNQCSKMRPFNKARKVKSTLLSQMICEHSDIVYSFGPSFFGYIYIYIDDSHLGFSEIVRFILGESS